MINVGDLFTFATTDCDSALGITVKGFQSFIIFFSVVLILMVQDKCLQKEKFVTREKKENEYTLYVSAYTSYLHFLCAKKWFRLQ